MTHVVPSIEDVHRMAIQQGQNLTELQGRLNQQDRVLHEVFLTRPPRCLPPIPITSSGPTILLPPPPETREGSDDNKGM
ncbi:hypothetical protein TIFTF001_038036 [Ficus carica]|uniref:Uncharacterized protein n=1 Tax=Ficus carica TaxID=3494 RepID=A0AA88E840_FICCA|nr:hypothetical protein TIFTF001_038036 [Ficus carica]